MGFFDKYPYTDFHELNLDWLIKEMRELDLRLDNALENLKAELIVELQDYIDEEVSDITNQFNTLKSDFTALSGQFSTLDSTMSAYVIYVNGKLNDLNARITAEIQGVNDRTDVLIASNNQFIFDNLSQQLRNLTVINYFTGEEVTIQAMFDYLAQLHLNDSIDYDTMAARAKTYTQLVALNINYTNLAMHGNTLYV